MANTIRIPSIEKKILGKNRIQSLCKKNDLVLLIGKEHDVLIGNKTLVKVNVIIGITEDRELKQEIKKIEKLSLLGYKPDTMMDTSINKSTTRLYKEIIEIFKGPVGTLPHYLCFDSKKGIDKGDLLSEIGECIDNGISWFTFHITPDSNLIANIKNRIVPCTSRGGYIVIKDMLINKRKENIFIEILDELISLLKNKKVAVSLGTTFRPGTIFDALDYAHLEEMNKSINLSKIFIKNRIPVMMEGIGHISLKDVLTFADIIKSKTNIPFIPLGPLPIDSAGRLDHIATSIGFAFSSYFNCGDLINVVTSREHAGGIPSTESTILGLKAAKISAHAVNVAKFGIKEPDFTISKKRAKFGTCNVKHSLFNLSKTNKSGCDRCKWECPFLLKDIYKKIL